VSAVELFLPYRIAAKPTNVGAPGAKMYVYAPGTTTKRAVYSTSSLTTQLSNPVIADGAGKFPNIYLDNALTYKLVITDKSGATLDTFDPYIPGQAPDASALQPYQDAAAASASDASDSATAAATSATSAAASATSAASSATSASGSASSASASQVAIASAIAEGTLVNASLNAATRTILAGLSHASGLPAILTESGREGVFKWSSANNSANVTSDPNQIVYVAPTSDATGSSGAWVRVDHILTPFMAGCVGDGTTDDGAKLQAFNDFFFASIRSQRADFTGNFATNQTIYIGPSSATSNNGPRYNVGGSLYIVAKSSLAEICHVRHLETTKWTGGIQVTGTGGTAYSTRTCGIGIHVEDCAVARFDFLKSYFTQFHGVFIPTDGESNDNLSIGTLRCFYAGSAQSVEALTANWSAASNTPVGSWSGSFGQRTVMTVDALPPTVMDAYVDWANPQAIVEIGGEPYTIMGIDRGTNQLTIFPCLDSTLLTAGSGTLQYIFGATYSCIGGDAGVISIDQVHSVVCGIGLGEASLYGSHIGSATIESAGVNVLIGIGAGSAHVASHLGAVYAEDCIFDVVNIGGDIGTEAGFHYFLGEYLRNLSKCYNRFAPRNSDDTFNGGEFGSSGGTDDLGSILMAYKGRWLTFHQNNLSNPDLGPTIHFRDHQKTPGVYTRNTNSSTIQLHNLKSGKYNELFGFRGAVWNFIGTGTNLAPTGTFTFAPPTHDFASCTTTSGSPTVTLADTRGMSANMPITGTGIPGSTTIASVDSRTQITLSANATASGTVTLTVTGSVNGAFSNATFSGFGGIVSFLIVHSDIYEMVWQVQPLSGWRMNASTTYDPPSIASGASTTTTVTLTGVALGDKVSAAFSRSLSGLTMTAYVSAANTVTVVLANLTGGAVDLASGTLTVYRAY
jgi:hypothetical protein